MTLIAGVIARRPSDEVDARLRAAVQGGVSRRPGERLRVFESSRALLVKLDVGAFGSEAFRLGPSGSVALLAGEPHLRTDGGVPGKTRQEDLARIQDHLDREDLGVLREAEGTFCAAHYDPARGTLSLVGDKVGLRPLYVWSDERHVIFAGALRVLEALEIVPKVMNVGAVTELIAHGFPLGTRTPYSTIRTLYAGQVLRFLPDRVEDHRYWRWDELPPAPQDEGGLLDLLTARFRDAVARRIGKDRVTRAFLSGGLDSRCIVGALRVAGATVHTYTFALVGSRDQVYSDRFAEAAGAIHHPIRLDNPTIPSLATLLRETIDRTDAGEIPPVDRPGLIWSGDGGSVGVGCSYMTPRLVRAFREGPLDSAVRSYMTHRAAAVRARVLRPEVARRLELALVEGILDEFRGIHVSDGARALHLFLLLNDQRRHLVDHFEKIDLHRVEYVLPFFDASFLAIPFSAPIDLLLGHRLYNRWLHRFPPAVYRTPWQAYPGHEPCPLQEYGAPMGQWDASYDRIQEARERPKLLQSARAVLESRPFPDALLSRGTFRLITWLHRHRFRDYRYLLTAADVYARYWGRSAGRAVLPDGSQLPTPSA